MVIDTDTDGVTIANVMPGIDIDADADGAEMANAALGIDMRIAPTQTLPMATSRYGK